MYKIYGIATVMLITPAYAQEVGHVECGVVNMVSQNDNGVLTTAPENIYYQVMPDGSIAF